MSRMWTTIQMRGQVSLNGSIFLLLFVVVVVVVVVLILIVVRPSSLSWLSAR